MKKTIKKVIARFSKWAKKFKKSLMPVLKTRVFAVAALLVTFNVASAAIAPEAAPVINIESSIESSSFVGVTSGALPKRVMKVTMTAYSSTPDQTDDTPFITATGDHVADGIVAANFLPFNTYIQIPKLFGNKVFVVKDRMHPRFSDRVDIWFADRAAAMKFGIRTAEIVIL